MSKRTPNFACIAIAVKSIDKVSRLLKYGSNSTKEKFVLEQELHFYIIKLMWLHTDLIGALNTSVIDLAAYVNYCRPVIELIVSGLPEDHHNDYLNKYEVVNTWNMLNPSEAVANPYDPQFACMKPVSRQKFRLMASTMALIKKCSVLIRKDKKRMLARA